MGGRGETHDINCVNITVNNFDNVIHDDQVVH